MKTITYTTALTLLLPLLVLGGNKDRRSKQVKELFINLEKGLFGEKDFKKASRLVRRASEFDRPWLLMALAQYRRTMAKDAVEGLRLLAPEVLPASKRRTG